MLKFLPIAPAPEEELSSTTENETTKKGSIPYIVLGVILVGVVSYILMKNKNKNGK